MAWLDANPPVRDQWFHRRNRPLTGCTVLHTAEGVMDSIGPDTGAENTARFIQRRTTPGSYHDLVDSDSNIYLVDYSHGAYHDGTGSNNWALSLSFACRTVDWRAMTPEKRRAFLRQGAIAFKRQQDYRRAVGAPLTELRLLTKAQSDAGMSGFIYHGTRDPGRRTDPGTTAAAPFPFNEFIAECRAVMAGEEEDMPLNDNDLHQISAVVRNALETPLIKWPAESGGDQSVLTQLQLNAQGLALVYGELRGVREGLSALAADNQALTTEDLAKVFQVAQEGAAKGARSVIDDLRVVPADEVPST